MSLEGIAIMGLIILVFYLIIDSNSQKTKWQWHEDDIDDLKAKLKSVESETQYFVTKLSGDNPVEYWGVKDVLIKMLEQLNFSIEYNPTEPDLIKLTKTKGKK